MFYHFRISYIAASCVRNFVSSEGELFCKVPCLSTVFTVTQTQIKTDRFSRERH